MEARIGLAMSAPDLPIVPVESESKYPEPKVKKLQTLLAKKNPVMNSFNKLDPDLAKKKEAKKEIKRNSNSASSRAHYLMWLKNLSKKSNTTSHALPY